MPRGDRSAEAGNAPGFLHSCKLLLAALTSAFHTRVELLVTELEEEKERIRRSLVLILLAFFGLSLGFILTTIFAVAIFWEKGWIAAIGILALIYLGVGAGAVFALRQTIVARPRLLHATLEELARDRDRLRSAAHE